MSEDPIERLNYFNGQRLEAEDLRLEQRYHLRIQRWLSKSLFSPGVADGFEVYAADLETPAGTSVKGGKVIVAPGLALDDLGQAIILVNPVELLPQARFLCVRYRERRERVQDGSCVVNTGGRTELAHWGGAERITSEPEFLWRRDPPLADARELIIAELALGPACTVERVLSGPRKLALAASMARVRVLSFEGEKDIDKDNSKVIRFHIARRRPTSVVLHLRSARFSSLHYTEMGEHNHNAGGGTTEQQSLETDAAKGLDAHVHGLNAESTAGKDANDLPVDDGAHGHDVDADIMLAPLPLMNASDLGLVTQHSRPGTSDTISRTLTDVNTSSKPNDITGTDNRGGVKMVVYKGGHHHKLIGKTDALEETPLPLGRHTHDFSITTTHALVGAKGKPVRAGDQLSFLYDLQITIDQRPCTPQILAQIKETNSSVWANAAITTLGNGPAGQPDPLLTNGTGPIRLDLIEGLEFDAGRDHEIELSVRGDGNGGCIQYNLYVE